MSKDQIGTKPWPQKHCTNPNLFHVHCSGFVFEFEWWNEWVEMCKVECILDWEATYLRVAWATKRRRYEGAIATGERFLPANSGTWTADRETQTPPVPTLYYGVQIRGQYCNAHFDDANYVLEIPPRVGKTRSNVTAQSICKWPWNCSIFFYKINFNFFFFFYFWKLSKFKVKISF